MGRRKRKVTRPAAAPAFAEADRARLVLRGVVFVYLFLGWLYVSFVPVGTGPDESAHLRYVEWVLEHRSLPRFDRTSPGPDYEFHQPPLYYLLAAPAYAFGRWAAPGDSRAGAAAARSWSLLVSLALIYLTFALGRVLAPASPWAAAGAAGTVAFLPMHLYLSTCVGNDVLTEIWFAAALVLMALHLRSADQYRRGERERPPGIAGPLGIGVVVGLAILTKSASVLLVPVSWLVVALAGRGRTGFEWARAAGQAGLCTLAILLVAGWWLVRNQLLYGDPLAQQAFVEAFTQGSERRPSPADLMQNPAAPLTPSLYVLMVAGWTWASALGMFGSGSGNQFHFFPWWVNAAFAAVAAAGLLGWVRYLRQPAVSTWQRQMWAVAGLVALLLLASFVRFNLIFFQAQARYLFPGALPSLALAVSLGLGGKKGKYSLLLPATLAVLSAAALPWLVVPQ